jgi:acyl-coenzyme A synthetase/AMP-(fatty) acid ligase
MSATVKRNPRVKRPVVPLNTTSFQDGVIGRFQQVLGRQPDAVAVTDPHRELTFAQLAAEAAAVLATIRTVLPEGPEPVALLHTHDASAVSALLGTVASGHPVLVLDPHTPAPRLKTLTEQVDARLCLTDAAQAATAAELVQRVALVAARPARPQPTAEALAAAEPLWSALPAPTAAAVIAFTSGSTGRPKVVANDHQMLVRDAWLNSEATGCYTADDVIAHTLPMAFHAGLMVTLAGLLVGATMKLYDVRTSGIGALAGWLEQEGASVMHASPGILRAFVATKPQPAQLARLRSLTIAGEAAYARDLETIRNLLPGSCTIRNRYGSSETGLIAEFAIGSDAILGDGVLPTGFGVGDTRVELRTESGRPVPPGEAGIVTVTAPKTAMGYWHDPVNTAAAFTDNPDGSSTYRTSDLGRFDPGGRLILLGRRDHSVKIRGYLVEPGEVDAALFALGDVREAVVVGSPRPSDGLMRLVAYVVSTAERPSAAAVRAALHARLPGYMVPETIVFLDALPRTDRGKLDRSALPKPNVNVGGSAAEELSDWEDAVRSLWCKVLALTDISLKDDFFELGGDSLAAEALLSLMVSELGVREADARTSILVQAPTLGQFARRLHRRPGPENQNLIPLRATGSRPPVFIATGGGGLGVALVPVVRHLDPEQPVYALQAHALERRGLPDWSVRASARRHIGSIRGVQPTGPYYLAGHSFGGLVALEIAHQLRRAGHEVALLVLLDSFPPDPSLQPVPAGRPLRLRFRELVSLATTGLRGVPGLDQYWRFYRQSAVLHRRYRCEPWPGAALVVLADSPERAERSKWAGHLTGPWRTVDVKGDHITMMRDPDAADTARVLAEGLREAQTRAGRG